MSAHAVLDIGTNSIRLLGATMATVIVSAGLAEVLDDLVSSPTDAARCESVEGLDPERADVIVAGTLLLSP